ncbi:beta-ketoacyl-ACP synthase [Thermosynechococcaceae cyanobacterium BACA0444]|uniref:Beta-ketoacyl-ACP synthase n=1 Tax=Pseudocalidococcus azoricus BACA0444 TaxID=2918990 RepID=A0AAE4FT49_9CYAN|nr:beta-ketoacyl-ACP synthase [Pseudocalidococcus azoricus]MDS3860496.1 beta-ketoacyl-ACP synthase [Pseudocalidococcus azoricus BACA0444]
MPSSQAPIVVTGISLVSALGHSAEGSWQRLCLGQSGLQVQQPYPEHPPLPLGLIHRQPTGCLTLLDQLLQALLTDTNLCPPLPHCGIVIGSSRGLQYQWEAWLRLRHQGGHDLDLGAWWASLPQSLALSVATKLQTQAPVLSPTAACATGIWAIAHGILLIKSGQCQQVIVGAVETPITPLTLAGFRQMGALCQTGVHPFDRQRQGFALGEGGALLLLETQASAIARQAKIYGQILGVGLTADGLYLTAPDHQARGMLSAVKTCLTQARLSATEIDHIHAHGTGTRLNDQAEAQWIQQLCPDVPISASKGSTGHTLGAAGAMATVFSLLSLRDHVLFPTVGLRNPAFDLNFITSLQARPLEKILCCSYGFGGQNAVIGLGR